MSTSTYTSTGRVQVTLPDMFQGFLEPPPAINPAYLDVKPETLNWLRTKCKLAEPEIEKFSSADFSLFVSQWVPEAPRELLRLISDWNAWIFLWDDLFDDGELGSDFFKAQCVFQALLDGQSVHESQGFSEQAMIGIEAHRDILCRLNEHASPAVLKRYRFALEEYSAGVLDQIYTHTQEHKLTIEEMVAQRRLSAGARFEFVLMQFGHNIQLPEHVTNHAIMLEIETICIDFVVLHNDLISCLKEELEPVAHNLVARCRQHGMSAQKAFDYLSAMLDLRFDRLEKAEAALPCWGAAINEEARRYVEGCKGVCAGVLHWSFQSTRYLGEQTETVRKSRKLDVLEKPPYLLTIKSNF